MIKHIIEPSVPPFAKKSSTLISKGCGSGELTNVHFSSSGIGKFYIIKNEVVLATLFNGHWNYNAPYMHSIKYFPYDEISVMFENREDLYAQDMYLSFEESVNTTTP